MTANFVHLANLKSRLKLELFTALYLLADASNTVMISTYSRYSFQTNMIFTDNNINNRLRLLSSTYLVTILQVILIFVKGCSTQAYELYKRGLKDKSQRKSFKHLLFYQLLFKTCSNNFSLKLYVYNVFTRMFAQRFLAPCNSGQSQGYEIVFISNIFCSNFKRHCLLRVIPSWE